MTNIYVKYFIYLAIIFVSTFALTISPVPILVKVMGVFFIAFIADVFIFKMKY